MDSKHNTIGHETDTGDVRAIGLTGVSLAIGIGIVLLLVYGMFQYLKHRPIVITPENPLAETDRQQFPPAPRIEEQPFMELRELRSQEESVLSTYGWMDKKAGIVRIPIDRAIVLQLQRGFPVRREVLKK
jgi:hypothetical protein